MSEVDYDTIRKALHQALEDLLSENDVQGVISGWMIIYERVHEDGERSLTMLTADAMGEKDLPPWTGEGLLRHVAANYEIYEGHYDDEEEDEEDG